MEMVKKLRNIKLVYVKASPDITFHGEAIIRL